MILSFLTGFIHPWGVSAFWLCSALLCLAYAYKTDTRDTESIVIYQVLSVVFALLGITWNL